MKIYQNSKFVQENNKIICTIECKYVPYFCGKPKDDEAIEFTVSAYSKCHPGDTFNETYGKRLAETRASEKVYKKIKSILQERTINLLLEIDELNQDLYRNTYLLETTKQHDYTLSGRN